MYSQNHEGFYSIGPKRRPEEGGVKLVDHIEIHGEQTVRLPTALDECAEFESVTHEVTVHCCESGHIGDIWTGIPLSDLVVAASIPADATHVIAECRDGFRVCVDVVDALDAILAYRCDGISLDRGGIRLVGPSIDSTRSAKGVTDIHSASLKPGDDPSDLEVHDPVSASDDTV